nr:hypothetical protein [Capnocytophaga endodontalis]
MPQIITNTAELSCNQGTATSNLPCWRELVARAYYNKSVLLIPYQLL